MPDRAATPRARALAVAALLFLVAGLPAAAAAAGPCRAFTLHGVRLGMSSDEVRGLFDGVGAMPRSVPVDGEVSERFAVGAAAVRVRYDRRPRRRAPARVLAVESRTPLDRVDVGAMIRELDERLALEGVVVATPSADAGESRSWTLPSCPARLSLRVERQSSWWEPIPPSVVLELSRPVESEGSPPPPS